MPIISPLVKAIGENLRGKPLGLVSFRLNSELSGPALSLFGYAKLAGTGFCRMRFDRCVFRALACA
jgi:hypothetical protein